MEEREYIELLELQTRIKEGVAEAFPGRYWVKAEIASWSPRSNGHCYLSLTQSRGGKPIAESRAMIWKWNYTRLTHYFEEATGEKLRPGITVLVKVQVAFSELYGMSLYIEDIDAAFTLGAQALERKRAIERLEKSGHMEMQKELAIPDIPQRLAVITSKTAAGYQDFRNHLLQNPEGYAFSLDLYEALMQGEQAPSSIMAAILEASEKGYDAILILRGGGSETDLQCFDSYELGVVIAECPIPVVTAIGHDKDVHIADMVAHASVKTPTALADLFLDAMMAQDEALDSVQARIGQGISQVLMSGQRRLDAVSGRIRVGLVRSYSGAVQQKDSAAARIRVGLSRSYSAAVQKRDSAAARIRVGLARSYSSAVQKRDSAASRIRIGLSRKFSDAQGAVQFASGRISKGLGGKFAVAQRLVDGLLHRVKFAATSKHGAAFSDLALKEALINGSDPRKILGLGYVLVTGKDNKVLKTVDRVAVGDRIGVRFSDGSLTAKVDEIYSDKIDNTKTNIA